MTALTGHRGNSLIVCPASPQDASGAGQMAEVSRSHYRVRLAANQADVRAAQLLRFVVFNLELREGLEQSYSTCLDADAFDPVCDHLLVEDLRTGDVVGTYRLQTGRKAGENLGYYSAQEFDFSPYDRLRQEMVELGRACVHSDHRNLVVLGLLWKGIANYAASHGCRYLIGCSFAHFPGPGHWLGGLSENAVFPRRRGVADHTPAQLRLRRSGNPGGSAKNPETPGRISHVRRQNLRAAGARQGIQDHRFSDVHRFAIDTGQESGALYELVFSFAVKKPFRAGFRLCLVTAMFLAAFLDFVFRLWLPGRAASIPARAQWLHFWARRHAWIFGLEITFEGKPPGRGILASNHLSYLDILVYGSIQPLVFLSKSEVRSWPCLGILTRCA